MPALSAPGSAGISNDFTTLNGLFKNTYANKVENLIPEDAVLQQLIEFLPKEENPGLQYNQPVIVALEQGVTYGGSNPGAIALDGASAGQVQNATVRGTVMAMQGLVPYDVASRSIGSQAAFEQGIKFILANLMDSFTKKLETELMYGQSGLAIINDNDATPGETLFTTVTSATLPIKTGHFASGIWAGANGMKLDLVRAGSVVNTAAPLIVTGVSFDNKTVSVSCTTAFTVIEEDVLYPRNALGKQMAGLHAIATNTGSMFGIDASVYDLWKSTVYDANPGGASVVLSHTLIQKAVAAGVAKGMKGDVVAIVNPAHWDDLITTEAGLRMYDSSYKSEVAEAGAKSIKFYSQTGGMIEIKPSMYCKEGFCYIFSPDDFYRVGSSPITFKRPGKGDEFFRDVEGFMAYELRAYTDQSLFSCKPSRVVLITNLKSN